MSTIDKNCFFPLNSYSILIMFGLFERALPVHINSTRISESLIRN